jgi:transposase
MASEMSRRCSNWLNDVLERMVSGEVKINELDQFLPWIWQPSGDSAMRLAA